MRRRRGEGNVIKSLGKKPRRILKDRRSSRKDKMTGLRCGIK